MDRNPDYYYSNELVIDANTRYFEERGGYEYARAFYEEAYRFACGIYGEGNIVSAVMHADEINKAVSEQMGKPVYHYHLHIADITENIYTEIGSYKGLVIFAAFSGVQHILTLKNAGSYRVEIGPDPRDNLIRIDNALADMPDRLERHQTQLVNLQQQMAAAKEECGKPFPREAELQQKSARLAELDAQLNIGGQVGAETAA